MLTMFMAVALFAQVGEAPAIPEDVKLLLETIEAIQEPIKDFRYEYEGSFRAMGPVAKEFKVEDGGVYDTFSGTHIQNSAGDVRDESLHRLATGAMTRDSLAVRKREGEAEQYSRPNGGSVGITMIKKKPEEIATGGLGFFDHLLLLEGMKKTIANTRTFQCSVGDGQLDSRPVKVVSVAMTGAKDHVLSRYYVDLSRGGHVIRCTSYSFGGELQGQADVKLSSFRVDGKEVWMPVSVEHFGSMALNRKTMTPYLTRKPTSREKIVVVGGTMAFNTNPSRDTFTLDYTPGTPISDQRRKMTTEFGKQKISPNPTKVEADAMLKEQLAKAEAQKRELVASPSEGIDWVKWLPLAGILAVGASSIGLWRQRRRSH